MNDLLSYVIITPARNEDAFLEQTIQSVLAQTIKPLRWVIVSDGSTDRTDEIAQRYADVHPWIEFYRMPDRVERNFAGKVGSFSAGYARVRHLSFDVIVSLDADITFEPSHFQFLLGKLSADPLLGLTGTPFSENGQTYDYRFSSVEHVSGACQVFRRECYDAIGGYLPVKGGGIDVIAVLSARMKGWRTRTWPEKHCIHHRPMGSGNHRNPLAIFFALGKRQYRLGFHPLWQTARSVYQMANKPYVLSGTALFFGYFWAMLCREKRPISQELVAFQQRDQMRRLREFIRSRFPMHRSPNCEVK